MGEPDSQEERQARSLALEKAYVHDVYDQIAPHFTDTRYRAWPRVKQFLLDVEPYSLVADVGCGNGKYLGINPDLMMIGSDHCAALTAAARTRRNHEVLTCDNLQLPFRDETFDAVLSIAVIHHFATTDRRLAAIKELARILRIGGKVLITVWAMEQRHRKFDSQDVLVPWHEPVKSSSEDRGSSIERDVTSTTTSDDDVLVYHAYSHISDSECHHHHNSNHHTPSTGVSASRKRQKYRNGSRGRYRNTTGSMEQHHHCADHHQQQKLQRNSSQSSSELSSPSETCYSFVRRALQKLSNSGGTTGSPSQDSLRKSEPRPYLYRSCRKPCISDSMEFGSSGHKKLNLDSPRCDFFHQDSIDSEYHGHEKEDDVPIELRHLEGYEPCMHCGSPVREGSGFDHCERNVCTSCLPIDPDPGGKKSRSLGDFLNMIPRLLRVKKCEKEPLSDLHKRISTASDPREYVVKHRDANTNGIVRSKSTVSFMSRLEELMSLSNSNDREELETVANPNCTAGPRSKPQRLPSLTSSFVDGGDCLVSQHSVDLSTNPRRYNCPADALKKLRQEASLEEKVVTVAPERDCVKKEGRKDGNSEEKKLQNKDPLLEYKLSKKKKKLERSKDVTVAESFENQAAEASQQEVSQDGKHSNAETSNLEGHISSYYSMPELYKLAEDQIPEESIFHAQKQRHISFYEQAQNILGGSNSSTESTEMNPRRNDPSLPCTGRERTTHYAPHQRGLVKRSLSVDTGDNSSSSHQVPRRFSASAAQGVLSSALRTYTLPRSCSRGSSVKSDTSVDSEESIVSVIPRKGNSITSDTSVDSEESCISVIQRSTSEIDTLSNQNGIRNNMSRLGSRSAQASPITVLSSQTSSAESSPPQSGKNDGRFPGSSGVIDQLVQQQQQLLYSAPDGTHIRHDVSEHLMRTRRCLIRPISDPRIEERFSFSSSEDSSILSMNSSRNSGRQTPKSNRGSLESEDSFGSGDKDKIIKAPVVNSSALQESLKKLELASHTKSEPEKTEEGDLSRTPSPIGPFRYITDPLITGKEPTESDTSVETITNAVSIENISTESKSKNLRFNPEVTKIEENKPKNSSNSPNSSANQVIESVIRNITLLTREANFVSLSQSKKETQNCSRIESNSDVQEAFQAEQANPVEINGNLTPSNDSEGQSKQCDKSPNKESDMRRSLSKLRERLESLTSSQGSLQGFDLLKNVSHTIQDIGAFRSAKEKCEMTPDYRNDMTSLEPKVSPTPVSLNDSRQSSLDESSQVTLSDESVVSAEGTSSVSDEANDTKRADDEDDQHLKSDTLRTGSAGSSIGTINALSFDSGGCALQKPVHQGRVDIPHVHRPTRASSFSDTELHSKKGSVRSVLRKRLRRSCVTIDEVECREVLSSEETSPSSSVSLEWNDFDKLESDSCGGGGACCSGVHAPIGACSADRQVDGIADPSVAESCCDDVNVAESETKFNVFVDKEMCVFFETPSSSIGKSASSSSNATDFSTTSDRIRGAMQREKSDDRSSKESDSDNLSKLSDVEAKSDSAFSEDYARKTDLGSSSSSASLDMFDSIRVKLGSSDSDGEMTTAVSAGSRQNWVLDNIDEIPDDDEKQHIVNGGEDCLVKSPTASTSWKPERSMDFAQRRENFFSCAADCRDMYRISFDDRTRSKEPSPQDPEFKQQELVEMAIPVPDLAPGVIELFPPLAKEPDENEAPTDILAAFVETLSDLTSVFGELYPRHEGKFEDVSSDDSLEISSFERILTSSNSQPSNNRQPRRPDKEKESVKSKETENKLSCKKVNGETYPANSNGKNGASKHKDNEPISNFVKLPPENDSKKQQQQHNSQPSNKTNCTFTKPTRDTDWKPKVNHDKQKVKSEEAEITKPQTEKNSPKETSKPPKKPAPEKLKILNRSSQSTCLDKFKQDSLEKEDDTSSQSAPCSPRLKPRQRSVEEVMSSSKAELSRNSSLSQSTSQESLPGNESGGVMAYHRYYHVFRQGELDSLIENHVENLHIISSYYDHANWCVIAEKVQVWTI